MNPHQGRPGGVAGLAPERRTPEGSTDSGGPSLFSSERAYRDIEYVHTQYTTAMNR